MEILLSVGAILTAPTIIYVVSRTSGWRILAERYPCHEAPPTPRKWLGYGVFRKWIGYNGAIVVSSNDRGLYLFPMPVVLSFCHKPIFIPWSEIREIRAERYWCSTAYEVHTARAPEVTFALRGGTFDFVRDHAIRAGVRVKSAQ